MDDHPKSVKDLKFTPGQNVHPSPRDWRDEAEGAKFQGGKLKGITRRLDYIKGLGCTAIWISPPFKNRQEDDHTPHGYGIQDFLAVDPRFGTLEDLQELVRQAHARDMRVILDIVINHTGNNWGYPNDEPLIFNPDGPHEFGFWRKKDGGRLNADETAQLGPDDGVWPIELQRPDAYHRRGQIRKMDSYGPEEGMIGDFFSLKDLDLTQPAVLDVLIQCYKYWIATCDVDGYRIDTVTHTRPEPTRIFCNAMREYAKSIGKDNFFLYAEIVAGDQQLQKYIGQNTPVAQEVERYPVFSACLDFPLYFVLEEVIKGFEPPTKLRERYESFRNFYRDYSEAGQYFVTFVDNHDQFYRPYKRFMNGQTDGRLAVLAIGYLLTNMGIPCMYYGTEQGFDGGGPHDSFVRETMFGGKWGAFDTTGYSFFNPDHPIYKGIAQIAAVRKEERALRYGREYFREISGDGEHFGHPETGACTLAFSRVLDTTEVLIVMNLEDKPRNDHVVMDSAITSDGTILTDLLSGRNFTAKSTPDGNTAVQLPLEARAMAILKMK
jgi:glycosidase